MRKANAIGGILSILTGALWVVIGTTDLSPTIGIVASMLVGGYWAFGRPFVAGDEMPSRDRDRARRR